MSSCIIFSATALAVVLWAAGLARCQQVSPLQGRNFPPENGTDVYVTVIIDRLLAVDDVDYRYQAMLYFQLSWRDPRAREAIKNSSAAADSGLGCSFPCTSLYGWTKGSACCDDIFLPGIEFINVYEFSQDRPLRYRVAIPEEGDDDGVDKGAEVERDAVVWWTYVLGNWYTPLQFKAFPFDKQFLIVQCQYADRNISRPVRFIPSAVGTQLNRPRTGDDFSGWNIEALDVFPFNFTQSVNELVRSSAGTTYSHPNDPWPLNPQNSSVEPFESILWTEGFDVVIEVRRISLYFVIVAILPIAVNVWLSLLVFFISPKHLDTRIGICVTMFLALTAIQFVIASVLPSSSTVVPTQQLVILSYVVMALIAIMSIIVYTIAVADRRKEKKEMTKQARTHFSRRWTTFVRGVGAAAVSAGTAAASEVSSRFRDGDNDSDSAAAQRPQQGASKSFPEQSHDHEQESRRKAAARPPCSQGPTRVGGQFDWEQEPAGRSSTHFGGVGVCTPSSDESTDDSEDEERKSYKSSGSEAGTSSRAPRHSSHQLSAAALPSPPAAILKDKQQRLRGASSAGGNSSRRRLPGGDAQGSSEAPNHDVESGQQQGEQQQWRQGEEEDKGAGKMRGGLRLAWGWGWWRQLWLAPARWFRLQHLKFKEMVREAQTNREYAMFLAHRTDRITFWIVVVGYNISIVIIFAVGASKNPSLPTYPDSTVFTV